MKPIEPFFLVLQRINGDLGVYADQLCEGTEQAVWRRLLDRIESGELENVEHVIRVGDPLGLSRLTATAAHDLGERSFARDATPSPAVCDFIKANGYDYWTPPIEFPGSTVSTLRRRGE